MLYFQTYPYFMALIKSIRLRNILCHEYLQVNFTKNITIITGPNGSGKSAIMVAIGFVLGIKRNVHQRGKTNSDLLKTNTNTGFIKITLNNDTFKRDFFTDEIIIERTITQKMTKLKIMNENNKVWSNKVEDLLKIVDHFGLHFENPLNYLTQDMAKIFLCVSKEEDLYDLYLKGTEIKDLRKLHEETQVKADEINANIEELRNRIINIENSININKDRSKVLDSVVEISKRLNSLENELKWSYIDFNARDNLQKDLDCMNLKVTELVVEENSLKDEKSKLTEELKTETQVNMKEQKEQHKIKMSVQKEIEGLMIERREVENELKEIQTRIEKIQKNMESVQNVSDADFITIIDNIQDKIENTKKEKTELETELESIHAKNKGEDEKLAQYNKQMLTAKRMLDDAMKIKTSQLAFFGTNFDFFLSEIKRTKFKNQVIGPIASEITLKDPKWYKPVSIILGKILSSFVVYDQADRNLLQQIIKRNNIKGVSILIPTTRDNLIKYEQNKDHLSVIDVIKCRDTILNILIMLAQIERIILIESRDVAVKVITKRPTNVDCAYILNGDVIRMIGGSITDFSARNEKFYFESSGARIDEHNARINNLSNLISKIKKHDSYNIKKKVSNLEVILNRLELELKENEIKYKAMLETQQLNEDDMDEEKLNSNVDQRNELMNLINEFDKKISIEKEKLNFVIKTGNKTEKLQSNIEKISNKLLFISNDRQKQEEIFTLKKNELAAKCAKIESECDEILKNGPKNDNPRESSVIEDEILITKAQINVARQGLSREELEAQLQKLEEEKKQNHDLMKKYDYKSKIFNKACSKRVIKREEIMKNESKRAALDFKNYTKERDYIGELIFDHNNDKLSIVMRDIKTTKKSYSNKIRVGDKNTLSGGERTFAGICLLMSLWPSVNCPVKILDEFDVYMDNLNRVAAINALIQYFKKNGGQAILISPLGMIEMDGVHIQVLDKPVRDTSN